MRHSGPNMGTVLCWGCTQKIQIFLCIYILKCNPLESYRKNWPKKNCETLELSPQNICLSTTYLIILKKTVTRFLIDFYRSPPILQAWLIFSTASKVDQKRISNSMAALSFGYDFYEPFVFVGTFVPWMERNKTNAICCKRNFQQ